MSETAGAESKGAGLVEALQRGWDDGLDLEDGIAIAIPFDVELVRLRAEVERLTACKSELEIVGDMYKGSYYEYSHLLDQAEARAKRLETVLREISAANIPAYSTFAREALADTPPDAPGEPAAVDDLATRVRAIIETIKQNQITVDAYSKYEIRGKKRIEVIARMAGELDTYGEISDLLTAALEPPVAGAQDGDDGAQETL